MSDEVPNHAHLRPLGVITANFQVLEMTISLLAWALVGPDQKVGQMATVQMSFGRICKFASALAAYRIAQPEVLEDVLSFIDAAMNAEHTRNQMVHSAWSFRDDAPGVPYRLKITLDRKHQLKFGDDAVSIEDMKALGKQMHGLIIDGTNLLQRLHDAGIVSGYRTEIT